MELTGIEIVVNGKKKFVGKVGVCPQNNIIPILAGYVCFYREVLYRDVMSYSTNCFGVDYDAWQKAESLGAKGMVIYCPDRQCMVLCKKEVVNNSFVLDLGEYPQVRIKPDDCKIYEDIKEGIKFGYTKNVVTVKPKDGFLNEELTPKLF